MNHTPLAPIFVRVNRASELFGFSRDGLSLGGKGSLPHLQAEQHRLSQCGGSDGLLDGGAAGREHGLHGEFT